MSYDQMALLTPAPTMRIGRARKLHRPHILIKDNRVVIHTHCGIDPTNEGFTETIAIPTCDECNEAVGGKR